MEITEEGAMPYEDDNDWYDDAACQGLGWTEFFDGEGSVGRRICATCPVRLRCLQFAINNAVTTGIWGGMTPLERRRSRLPRTWAA